MLRILMMAMILVSLSSSLIMAETADIPKCPKGHSSLSVREIIYGMPEKEDMEAASKGEVELGGCVVTENSPKYRCQVCKTEF